MRTRSTLLILVALTSLAGAQPPVAEWVTLDIAAFPGVVQPLQGPVIARFAASASCLLADETANVVMAYSIVSHPPWGTIVVSPTTDAASVEECENGRIGFEGQIIATASDQAPAFVTSPIVLEATTITARPTPQSQRAEVNLTPGFFSIVDIQLEETQVILPPGGSHEFVARVTNFGNGETRIVPFLQSADELLTVTMPPEVVLESKQSGGTQIAKDLVFRVDAASVEGVVNHVGVVNIGVQSAHASDATLLGDAGTVSFLVTVRTGGEESTVMDRLPMPLGWLGAIAALAVGSGLRRRG